MIDSEPPTTGWGCLAAPARRPPNRPVPLALCRFGVRRPASAIQGQPAARDSDSTIRRRAVCQPPPPMRICLVYDCLFPYTVGGAERWYRNLAERLAAEGHDVTFLTRRQWGRGTHVDVPGVRVVALEPRIGLYTRDGRRRIDQALLFGAGCLAHLALHGGRYDVVHTCAFPYFSLLAAAAMRPLHGYRLVADWFEVWTRDYWHEYLGRAGRVGWAVQRLCARVRHHPFCFSRVHARRLREEGAREAPTLLAGLYAGDGAAAVAAVETQPVAVFAGRHIAEKRVPALVPALARARERVPELRAEILGDGPERPAVLRAVTANGLQDAVDVPGFVPAERVDTALAQAEMMVLPSRREGYGMVVVEAAAHGTPSVVVADPDNAATELIDEGVNGVIAGSADPDDLADAMVRVHEAGPNLRASTAEWFAQNAHRLSMAASLDAVAAQYLRG
jgi:glycosyltransferase involved in cell wall biosynthesis